MCFLPSAFNLWDGVGAASLLSAATRPGYVLAIDDGGVLSWVPRRARSDVGRVIHDYGCQRLDVMTIVATSSGTNLGAGPIDGRHQTVGELAATSSTGRAARTFFANSSQNIVFTSSSGTWVYEIVFEVPTLPTVTNAFRIIAGFFDSNSALPTDGAYITYDQADGEIQCVTRSNTTETKTDSGVTVVAGTWYRAMIVVTNDSSVDFYVVADATGNTFGAAKAHHTTNIPSGAGRETSGGVYFQQTAGAARTMRMNCQRFIQRAPGSGSSPTSFVAPGVLNGGDGLGQSLGGVGTRFQMLPEPDRPGFTDYAPPLNCLPFEMIWTRGLTNRTFFEQGPLTATASADEDYYRFTYQLAAGSTTTAGYVSDWHGAAAPADVPRTVFDSTSETMVYETLVYVDTLSTGTNRVVFRGGWNDTTIGAPVDSIHVELDSNVDTEFQCVTRQNSTETRTDSGVTANAATWYQIRIVVTNDSSVSFYIKAHGTAWGSAVATHSTNIPSGTSRVTAPAFQADTAGNSNAQARQVRGHHLHTYQRLAA